MSSDSKQKSATALLNLKGRVTQVDEKSAVIRARQSNGETYEAYLRSMKTLQKAVGFRKVVNDVSDFLYVDDDVVVNMKKKNKIQNPQWTVTRLRLCPSPRPPCYSVLSDYFITQKKGPSRWPKAATSHVPPAHIGNIVTLISDILHGWCKMPLDLIHDIIDEYYIDLGGVFGSYIKTESALRSFIRTVPQYFYVDDDDNVCMYQGFENEHFKTEISRTCQSIPHIGRSHLLSERRIIQSVREGYAVLQPLLDRAERSGSNPGLVVALDCEGCSLSRTGRLTLVQIATMEGKVYLFDVLRCPHLFEDGLLADFLESEAVLKVIHDCRKDAAALYHQFGITLTNIFDTSIAYTVLQNQCHVVGRAPRPRISFQNLCAMVGEEIDVQVKQSIKKKMKYMPGFWANRPLKADAITYAAADVYMLLPNVYQTLDRLIHPSWKCVHRLMCEEAIKNEIEDM